MRFFLLIIFCCISLASSAQFWKKKKPVPVRYELLPPALGIFTIFDADFKTVMPAVVPVTLKRSVYDIRVSEDAVLKEAKHNMHFRVYNAASYNFSDLAQLYILQNRFSEAKWYLLQSNELSRQQNDDKHTIANLLDLAAIKLIIGEPALAKLDLQQAHDLAVLKGITLSIEPIEKRMRELELGKPLTEKAELHYGESVELAAKGQ